MSDNIPPASQTAADPDSPIRHFPRYEAMPKPQGDFPIATNDLYATYLDLFSIRIGRYNCVVDSINHMFANIIAEANDTYLLLLLNNRIDAAHKTLIDDLEDMEEKLLLGTLMAGGVAPAWVEVINPVRVPSGEVLIVRGGGDWPREGN